MHRNLHVSSNGRLPSTQARYAYQCFPVRNHARFSQGNDGSAWLVEYKTLRQQDYHKRLARESTRGTNVSNNFTGDFLVKHCYVEDAEDICILNVSGKNLSPVGNEDFSLFVNVVQIDASDNNLPLETFLTFPNLEDLELQVNSITSISISHEHFLSLKRLDLSYNFINNAALLALGKLRNLLDLSLRGCGLKILPPELARGYQVSDNDSDEKKLKAENKTRYPQLTNLDLSENELADISTFASLAGLRMLKALNLSCNKITGVPHLRLMAAHRHFSLSTIAGSEVFHVPDLATAPEDSGDNVPENEAVSHQLAQCDVDTRSDEKNKGESSIHVHQDENLEAANNENEIDNEFESVLEGIDETISRISSDKDAENTDELLNMDFAQELNFSLNVPMTTTRTVSEEGGNNSIKLQTSINHEAGVNMDPDDTFLTSANELLDDDLKRPFPCLEMIDLSYNQINDEHSLLALTSWPALRQLKLWGNPLSRANKGIPPAINHHLKVMCGINIIREEPRPKPKCLSIAPGLINSTKKRKVNDVIPPIKRNNLMAIEQMILQAFQNKSIEPSKAKNEMISNTKKDDQEAWMNNGVDRLEYGGENTFFLTQGKEEGIDPLCKQSRDDIICDDRSERSFDDDIDVKEEDIDELLKIDMGEKEDLIVPETIQGSVRALRHILDHQLVFNRGHYNKHKKPIVYKREKQQPRHDVVNDTLDMMRMSDHTSQENLAIVLEKTKYDNDYGKEFPEAREMMRRVQEKYDYVRANSLCPISEVQQQLKQYSTRVEQPSQDLVLSRMRKGRIGEVYSTSRGSTARIRIRGTRYESVLR